MSTPEGPIAEESKPRVPADERAWALLFHEDNLFHQRLEVFLVAHTLLIAPVGFVLSRPEPPYDFLLYLSGGGIVLGIIWWVVQLWSRSLIDGIERVVGQDPLYAAAYPHTVKRRRFKSLTFLLALVLPLLATSCWVLIFVELKRHAF